MITHRSDTRRRTNEFGVRHRMAAAAGAAAIALAIAGCGNVAEKVAEEGIERAIENEGGGDVEIDLDGDGGITFESDEGTVRVGEDGSFIVEGADGEVITGEADGDGGFTIEGEDGSAVFDVDGDTGGVQFETDDGGGSVSAGPGLPDAWPSAVPRPDGLTDVNNSVITGEGELFVSVVGTAPQGAEAYFSDYTTTLEGNGFTRSSFFEGNGVLQATFEGGDYMISVFGTIEDNNIAINASMGQ